MKTPAEVQMGPGFPLIKWYRLLAGPAPLTWPKTHLHVQPSLVCVSVEIETCFVF
jgi:hypothetical protein